MKQSNKTEIVFILDRSGSMAGLESDTVGGFNAMIDKQKRAEGEAVVSAVLFHNRSQVIYDRVPVNAVRPMTEDDYQVGGCTALLDAIGGAIHHIGNVHKYARPEDVPAHTVFLITTDGMENASHRYGSAEVKQMIRKKQEECGWEFIFLGANVDAVETAGGLGIRPERAVNYRADSRGTRVTFEAMSEAIHAVRAGEDLDSACWRKRIDKEFKEGK